MADVHKVFNSIIACMSPMNVFMVGESVFSLGVTKFVERVGTLTKAAAGAVFLKNEDDPNRLDLAGCFGYKERFARERISYYLDQRSFTGSVCKSGKAENLSAPALQQKTGSIARCRAYLPNGEFYNVAAAPILFNHGDDYRDEKAQECLGVLRLENQGTNPDVPFLEQDFELIQLVARFMGVSVQQRRFAQLWTNTRKKPEESRHEYFLRVTATLAKLFHAEISLAFVQLQSPTGVLRCEATSGIGRWSPSYTLQEDTVISLVAASGLWMGLNAERIAELSRTGPGQRAPDKFVQELSNTLKRDPSNLLVVPVLANRSNQGVLVVGNKKGQTRKEFSDHDGQAAQAFADHVAADFLNLVSGTATGTPGYLELQRVLGPSSRLKGRALRKIVRQVGDMRSDSESKITGDDCARYLQISRTYFLKLLHEPETHPSGVVLSQ